MSNVFNFNAGPAILPHEVLEEVQEELLDFKDSGISMLESSHRGRHFSTVHEEALHDLRTLLDVPKNYSIMFLQGGASMQFAMIPINFLAEGQTADYIHSGAWASKAIAEARCIGNVHVAADMCKEVPHRMPALDAISYSIEPAYVHVTSNETIEGIQWKQLPQTQSPLMVDNVFRHFYLGKLISHHVG